MSYVYHYTDAEGAMGIMISGKIKKSSQFNAAFGDGVYFTEFAPTVQRDVLVVNNYADVRRMIAKNRNKTDFYFAIKKSSLQGLARWNTRRNVLLYPGDVNLGITGFLFGPTPDIRELSSYVNMGTQVYAY